MLELKANLKTKFAESFIESLQKEENYLFLAKVDPWETDSSVFAPNSPKDSLLEENNCKKSIICAYKIYESDASLCVPRIDWENQTIYTEFDDSKELDKENLKYYVVSYVNFKYRVYKCLNNNNGSPSNIQPSGSSIEEEYLQDGYVWKFLYEIPEELEKFITDDYIPVPILKQNFYNDERSLQLSTQLFSKKGSIEEINIEYSDVSESTFNFSDIINQNYDNSSCVVLAKQFNSENGNILITTNISNLNNPTLLSSENNYYNNNYYIIFQTITEGYIIGTVKNYTINFNDSNIATIEITDIKGNAQNISIGTSYSIVPKVVINGDGTGAIAIPIFNNYQLIDIELISGGINYQKANAYFLINNEYKLNVIISPNKGHGSLAYSELNARNIMISKTLSKHLDSASVLSENKHFFGNGNNIHQFGIISQIESKDGNILSQEEPLDEITLIKLNSQVELIIPFYNNLEGDTEVPELFFNVNDIITRGSAFKKNQFRGKVLSVQIGTNNETIVLLQIQNGKFENYPNLNIKNETNKRTLIISDNTDDAIIVNYINLAKPDDYQNATHILGNNTLFTGKITKTNLFEEFIKISYTIEGIRKNPITASYTSSGVLIPGEPVTLLIKNLNNIFSVVENNFMNVLEIIPRNSSIDTAYSYVFKLRVNSRSVVFPSEDINQNSFLIESNLLDKYLITKDLNNFGRVVYAEYLGENNEFPGSYEYANIYIKPEKNNFLQFSNISDRELFLMESDPYSYKFEDELTSLNGFCDEINSEFENNSVNLDINSGQIVYLENIRPISLNDTQPIKVNIVLEF